MRTNLISTIGIGNALTVLFYLTLSELPRALAEMHKHMRRLAGLLLGFPRDISITQNNTCVAFY